MNESVFCTEPHYGASPCRPDLHGILIPGRRGRLLSVLYNLASFSLLALTSALTVHVLGNLTVVGNLILSRLLFGSRLSTLSYVGIALTLSGMFLYHNCEFVASWAARRGFWRRDQPGKGL